MSRGYESGPPCRVCGKAWIHVNHDGPEERTRNIAVWAMPLPATGNMDYYTWAGVKYHPFQPGEPRPGPAVHAPQANSRRECRDEYNRGYQAGYQAKRRAEAKP